MPKLRITIKKKQQSQKVLDSQYKLKLLAWFELMVPSYISDWIKTHQPFHSQTGMAIKSWKVTPDGNALRITNLMPYTYWLNYGVRPHKMTYLLNNAMAKKMAFGKYAYWGRLAVPLNGSAGLFFRSATVKSMETGKWFHPGYTGTQFLEKSLTAFVESIKDQFPELQLSVESLP